MTEKYLITHNITKVGAKPTVQALTRGVPLDPSTASAQSCTSFYLKTPLRPAHFSAPLPHAAPIHGEQRKSPQAPSRRPAQRPRFNLCRGQLPAETQKPIEFLASKTGVQSWLYPAESHCVGKMKQSQQHQKSTQLQALSTRSLHRPTHGIQYF